MLRLRRCTMSEKKICPICKKKLFGNFCPHCVFDLASADDEDAIKRARNYYQGNLFKYWRIIHWDYYFTGIAVSLLTNILLIFVLLGGHHALPWGVAMFCLPVGLLSAIAGESESSLISTVLRSIIFSAGVLLILLGIQRLA